MRCFFLFLLQISFSMVFDLSKVLSLNDDILDKDEKLAAAKNEVIFVLILCLAVDQIPAMFCVEQFTL